MKKKYIILFSIPEPFAAKICGLMDKVCAYLKVEAPYKTLPPHITFHQPIVGIDEQTIKNLTQSMSLQIQQTRITVSHLFNFGTRYVVLPVQATKATAALWVGITELLAQLPEYEHDQYDHDNTLHITIAGKIEEVVFVKVWEYVKKISGETMHIPLDRLMLYSKTIDDENAVWEKVEEYALRSRN